MSAVQIHLADPISPAKDFGRNAWSDSPFSRRTSTGSKHSRSPCSCGSFDWIGQSPIMHQYGRTSPRSRRNDSIVSNDDLLPSPIRINVNTASTNSSLPYVPNIIETLPESQEDQSDSSAQSPIFPDRVQSLYNPISSPSMQSMTTESTRASPQLGDFDETFQASAYGYSQTPFFAAVPQEHYLPPAPQYDIVHESGEISLGYVDRRGKIGNLDNYFAHTRQSSWGDARDWLMQRSGEIGEKLIELQHRVLEATEE